MRNTTIGLQQLLAGKPLALYREMLPTLMERAELHIAAAGGLKRVAGRFDSGGKELTVDRYGPVAIVPMCGPIFADGFLAWVFGGTTPDQLVRALRAAIADPDVTSVILLTNSPGGTTDLIQETASEVRRLADIKPIVALARTMMCSAAYWIGSQATSIVATPSALVGSVGTYCLHWGEAGMLEAAGITVTYISSSAEKVELASELVLSADAKAFVQEQVDRNQRTFVADVARGRGITPAKVRSAYGDGRAFDASECLQRGLVDSIGTIDGLFASLSSGRASRARAALPGSSRLALPAAIGDTRFDAELDAMDAAIAIHERGQA